MFISRLDPSLVSVLRALGNAASSCQMKSYLVGGMVRDVLLGLGSVDIDIMVEAPAEQLIEHLSSDWKRYFPGQSQPRKKVIFHRYGTGKLFVENDFFAGVKVIDFSTARREIYEYSGAKPIVSPGTLESDLRRRDFTVNALAVSLSRENFCDVIDLFSGVEHIQSTVLDVIHEKSFEDDPARLLRGIRLMGRYGFTLSPQTKPLFAAAVTGRYLSRLPVERLFDEFRKLLAEEMVVDILKLMHHLQLLEQIHSQIDCDEKTFALLQQVKEAQPRKSPRLWQMYLAGLFSTSNPAQFAEILKNDFHLPKKLRQEVLEAREYSLSHYAS